MADGDATEMAAAMVHGNRSNGPRQQRRRWAIAMAMVTVMAMELELEMAMAMAKETAMARATMKEGLPLHVAAMCSALDGRHLASTPMDIRKVHSPALHHGGDTAKSVCSPSRGRVPDS